MLHVFERTKGAVAMTEPFNYVVQVARPDADIVLDAAHMARPLVQDLMLNVTMNYHSNISN